jgi:hypothetical protein
LLRRERHFDNSRWGGTDRDQHRRFREAGMMRGPDWDSVHFLWRLHKTTIGCGETEIRDIIVIWRKSVLNIPSSKREISGAAIAQ